MEELVRARNRLFLDEALLHLAMVIVLLKVLPWEKTSYVLPLRHDEE
jgi:hypothetical protein